MAFPEHYDSMREVAQIVDRTERRARYNARQRVLIMLEELSCTLPSAMKLPNSYTFPNVGEQAPVKHLASRIRDAIDAHELFIVSQEQTALFSMLPVEHEHGEGATLFKGGALIVSPSVEEEFEKRPDSVRADLLLTSSLSIIRYVESATAGPFPSQDQVTQIITGYLDTFPPDLVVTPEQRALRDRTFNP